MSTATGETWQAFCAATTEAIREAAHDRIYGAAHPAPATAPRDLVDFCFSLGGIELAAVQLERVLFVADECGAQRAPTLRAHLPDLRHMQAELAALVSEAESA